uniref:medium-chain acyl-CoA ligase n=1 Tax=Ornithorhynchus anatinus TaxID=9258 RepID=F6UWX0_ORNAN
MDKGITCAISKEMNIKPGFLGKAVPRYGVQVSLEFFSGSLGVRKPTSQDGSQSGRRGWFKARGEIGVRGATGNAVLLRKGDPGKSESRGVAKMEMEDGKEPRHPALWWVDNEGDEVKWSFEELGIFSRQAANVLSENCGLKRGDRVAVILPRVPQWWLVCVGCMRAGLIFMPGTTQLTGKDIQYRLQVSKAKCVVTSDGVAPEVDSIVSSCPTLKTKLLVSDAGRAGWLSFNELLKTAPKEHKCVKSKSREPLAIYFTSGSTGSPKMVLHSHGSLGFQAVKYDRSWLSLTDADILWSTSDTGWIVAAILALFGSWSVGAGVFVHRLERFEPATILTTLSRFPITALSMAPTAYRLMVQNLESRKPLGRLRHCISAGEPLNPEVMEKWKASTGLEIRDVYGQTETGVVCAVTKEMKIKPGSMGKPTAAYDVQVVDENANILPPGMEGDIGIRIKPTRPFSLFSGYVDNPEKTAATERGNFYICGDRGVKDEDGYFWFLGRADDIINSSGYRIGPFEVESALIEHPAVVESAVVSSPDPVRGEVVKAFVVLKDDFASHDPERLTLELQRHVQTVTAPYKYPRKVEFVKELPKTNTGKIRRNKLRDQEWGRA